MKEILKRKDIEFSMKRYGIDALSAMAQGLFCSLLIGTILNTLGTQFNIQLFSRTIATVNGIDYTIGGLASAMSGPAMACAIGYALHCPPLVLFSLITVGFASNALGGAGGPLAVFFVSIVAAEFGKLVSKETKVDILVTPLVTILVGVLFAASFAPMLGEIAMKLGELIMMATKLQPFFMGILVSVLVGIALTLPISSAAICAALGLTGLAGGAAVAGCCAQMIGFAVISFRENGIGGLISQGIGTSMLQFKNILRKSLALTLLLSLFSLAVTYFGADFICTTLLGDKRAILAVKILSFSLPFMGAVSVLRGYFIAGRKASPSAVSQLVVVLQVIQLKTQNM